MVLSTFDEREQSIQQEFRGRKVPANESFLKMLSHLKSYDQKALLHSLDEHDRSSLGH